LLLYVNWFLTYYSADVLGSGNTSQEGSMPQISRPYSAIVRSELNLPHVATFIMAILAHKL
jgi:hypothetical protein